MSIKNNENIIKIAGIPNLKQQLFFDSRTHYTAYGGARGGGKSWALRRKLVALSLRYPGIHCLLLRRSYPELKSNHIGPMLREYGELLMYSEGQKKLKLKNGSSIDLGYCACDHDVLRYQGQEYDVIAIDEATQLSEYQFSVLTASCRGVGGYPRRIYLTCNPGGVGHAWVKRLFIDRNFKAGEDPKDYSFIPALVYDNEVLTGADPDYIRQLERLPARLRDAWLHGRWDVFEGQFFAEFDETIHVFGTDAKHCSAAGAITVIPNNTKRFIALDYGFDMLAALLIGIDVHAGLWVINECCIPGLTLGEAAGEVVRICSGYDVEYAVASPDLWNRRQDSGRSGTEIMQAVPGVPPMRPADNRRIPGWRVLREYLAAGKGDDGGSMLHISRNCPVLINSMQSLLCDPGRVEDAAGEPHALTHAPEALRYAVMSRIQPPEPVHEFSPFMPRRRETLYNI